MNRVITFFKNWTLPISMISGALGYFIYVNIPCLASTKPFVGELVAYLQPILIFIMLFLTFCRVKPSELRPLKWHAWLLLVQLGMFALLMAVLYLFPQTTCRIVLEGAMLCMLCPTATACAVVTVKLGGSAAAITTYTIFINIVIAVFAPLFLPMAHPQEGISFLPAFLMIIRKVFPLLICPLLLAWFLRYFIPRLHAFFLQYADMAFYIWGVGLALAIGVTCNALMHSNDTLWHVGGIMLITGLCCLFQFAVGKHIGGRYGMRIEGGQSLGQKNTLFIIWLGYTFLSPITATAGGFYSIFHNLFNAWQLYRKRKEEEAGK